MADYLKALGKMASEKSSEAVTGFARGAKGAFLSEMPGITSAADFASTLKKYANSKEAEVVKEQKVNNVISLEMVRQLRAVNASIANQTRLAAAAERRASAAAAFAEEVEREKALRDDKLLKAIQDIKSANDTNFKQPGNKSIISDLLGEGKDSFLGSLAGATVGTIVASVARGAITSLIRGGALAGVAVGIMKLVSDYLDREAVKNGLPRGSLQAIGPGLGEQGPDAFRSNSLPKNVQGGQGQAAALMALTGGTSSPPRQSMFSGNNVPLSVRQNNPGAMRPVGANKGFQSFNTPQEGISALENQLYLYLTGKSAAAGYRKLDTIAKMISVYAPSNENKTQNYINFVSEKTGIPADKKLTPKDIPAIAKAITQMEGGTQALQYFYGDNRGSAQRYGGGPPPTGDGVNGPVSRSLSSVLPITDTGDEVSRLRARYPAAANAASGTNLQGYVSFNQREALAKRFYFDTSSIAKNTARTAKGVEAQNRSLGVRGPGSTTLGRQVRPVQDPFTKYYESRTEALSKQFESTTRKLINSTITRAIFPDGIPRGIARETERNPRPGFLGNRISEYFSIQKKLTPTMNRIFGKQFGGQYASIFSQAGSLLLDKGANALGGMLGFDQNSPFSFQQVLGNILTKGKGKQAAAQRKLGREQAIFSLLGIPTGATTGLAFAQRMTQRMMPSLFGNLPPGATPQQQIAGLTNSALNMFGINQSTFGGILGGGMGMLPGTSSSLFKSTIYDGVKITQNDANVLKVQEGFTYDSWESATNQQEGFFNTLGAGLSKVFSNVGGGLADVLGGLLGGGNGVGGILNWGFSLLASLFSGSGGGTGGGMFGGGGFFSDLGRAWSGEMSWTDAILNTGMKVGGNLATNYLAYSITKNIKNPYAKLAAQQAANYVIKSGLQIGASALGYGDVASKFLGANTKLADVGSSFVNTLTGASNAGITEATLGELGINTANAVGSAGGPASVVSGVTGTAPITNLGGGAATTGAVTSGLTDAADIAVSSVLEGGVANAATSGANFVDFAAGSDVLGSAATTAASAVADAGGYVVGSGGGFIGESAASSFLGDIAVADVLPYAAAIVKLFQGDIKGAAGSVAGMYIGNLILPGIGGIIGSILGSFIGGGSKDPEPYVTYGIRVNNNNDPNAYGLTYAGRRGVPGELHTACIGLLKTLFAMIKKAQLTLGIPKLAHDYFTIHMNAESKGFVISVGGAPANMTESDGEGGYVTFPQHGQSWGRAAKDVAGGNFDDLKTSAGFAKISEPLLNEMLRDVSDTAKATAKSSISKLTSAELTSGVVSGMDQSTSTDIYGRSIYERNFKSGRTLVGDPEYSGTYYVDNPNSVYNAKTGQMQEETNLIIGGYNTKGEAVDLKGNVIDFNKFSAASAFTGEAAVREATEGGFTGSGEDAVYVGPTKRQVFNAKTGRYQDESNNKIVGYDKDGKPVINLPSSLPADWNKYTEAQKINYYNEKGITESDLLSAGVSQSDIDYMKTKGYGKAATAATSNTASAVSNGASLTYQQQQATNDALKNSNTTTANTGGQTNAVVNSGNVVNNNNTTVVDSSVYDKEFRFGSRLSSEMDAIAALG